jgi:hypothetical protein
MAVTYPLTPAKDHVWSVCQPSPSHRASLPAGGAQPARWWARHRRPATPLRLASRPPGWGGQIDSLPSIRQREAVGPGLARNGGR